VYATLTCTILSEGNHLSLELATCDYCGKELVFEFGTKSYTLTITEHRGSCRYCHKDSSKIETKDFCSFSCLNKWIEKRINPTKRKEQ